MRGAIEYWVKSMVQMLIKCLTAGRCTTPLSFHPASKLPQPQLLWLLDSKLLEQLLKITIFGVCQVGQKDIPFSQHGRFVLAKAHYLQLIGERVWLVCCMLLGFWTRALPWLSSPSMRMAVARSTAPR